jgi:LPXTG-motif cell wall-anchored protein
MVGVSVVNVWHPGFFDESWGPWLSANPWAAVAERTPQRQPELGWYDDTESAVSEQQLRWMADYGVDYVSYGWVWNPDGTSPSEASIDALVGAEAQSDVAFSLLWDATTEATRDDLTLDGWSQIVQRWLSRYMTRPEYLRIDGEPVVFSHTADDFLIPMAQRIANEEYGPTAGYLQGLRALNDVADQRAREAGFPGIYLISGLANTTAHWNWVSREGGFSANSGYNHHTLPVTTGEDVVYSESYDELDGMYRAHWAAGLTERFADAPDTWPALQNRPVEMTAGWDATPLADPAASGLYANTAHNQSSSTPQQFEDHLRAGLQMMEEYPEQTLGMGKIYAWNEFMEGSFVEPNQRWGRQYLEAISRVFGNLDLSADRWEARADGTDPLTVLVETDLRTWEAESSDPQWLSLAGAEGQYNGEFTAIAASNTTGAARTGTITVTAGGLSREIEVVQPADTGWDTYQAITLDGFQMGVAGHIKQADMFTEAEVASITDALGVDMYRDELYWNPTMADAGGVWKTNPGDSSISRFKVAVEHGAKILLILDYSHPTLSSGMPHTALDREAFAEYARRAIEAVGAENIGAVEVWNEWNAYAGYNLAEGESRPPFDTLCPNDPTEGAGCPISYAKLVGAVEPVVRQYAPGVPLLAGATASVLVFNDTATTTEWKWAIPMLEQLKADKVNIDGFSAHAYGKSGTSYAPGRSGRKVVADIATLAGKTAQHYGKELPVYITEMGWSTCAAPDDPQGSRCYSDEFAATALVEAYVGTRSLDNVAGLWWYTLKDKTPSDSTVDAATDEESNYGLYTVAGEPNLAGKAYAALNAFWRECTDVKVADGGQWEFDTSRYRLDCAAGDTRQIVLAATQEQLAEAQQEGWTAVDLLGELADVAPSASPASLVGRPVGLLRVAAVLPKGVAQQSWLVEPAEPAIADGATSVRVGVRVNDAAGQPVSDAEVVFDLPAGVSAGSTLGPDAATALTDSDGLAFVDLTAFAASGDEIVYRVAASIEGTRIDAVRNASETEVLNGDGSALVVFTSNGVRRPDEFYMGIASHLGSAAGWAVRDADGKSVQDIAMTEMGANSLRDELYWVDLGDTPGNARPGTYQPALDRLLTVPAAGGKLLMILDYGNPQWVDPAKDEGFPATREQREAFARYAVRMVEAIGPENLAGIEVWNEWDIFMGWAGSGAGLAWNTPCPVGDDTSGGCALLYAKLVEALVNPTKEGLSTPSLRQIAPGVPIIVGATHAFDPTWTRPMMEYLRDSNVQVDGYSTHPYATLTGNGCAVNWAATPLDEAKALCIKGARERVAEWYGQELPVYVTELGFTTGDESISPERQAELLVKSFVRTRSVGDIGGIWWYDLLQDYPAGDDDWEGGYGLIERIGARTEHKAGATRPAGIAYGALSEFWKGCTRVSGDVTENSYFQLTCPGGVRHVLFDASLGQLRQAQAQGATLVDLMGVKADVPPDSPVTSEWAGREVGILGGSVEPFTIELEGNAYRGQTVRAVAGLQEPDEYRWSSRAAGEEWAPAAYSVAGSGSSEYRIGGPDGLGWADFQGASGYGKDFRVEAVEDGEVVATVFFRPTTAQAAGAVAEAGVTSPAPGQIRIAGDAWAFDWEQRDRPGRLFVTVGAQCGQAGAIALGPFEATQLWGADQAAIYPQVTGSLYGFDKTFEAGVYGEQSVYFYAVPVDWTQSDGCAGLATTLGSGNGKTVDLGVRPPAPLADDAASFASVTARPEQYGNYGATGTTIADWGSQTVSVVLLDSAARPVTDGVTALAIRASSLDPIGPTGLHYSDAGVFRCAEDPIDGVCASGQYAIDVYSAAPGERQVEVVYADGGLNFALRNGANSPAPGLAAVFVAVPASANESWLRVSPVGAVEVGEAYSVLASVRDLFANVPGAPINVEFSLTGASCPGLFDNGAREATVASSTGGLANTSVIWQEGSGSCELTAAIVGSPVGGSPATLTWNPPPAPPTLDVAGSGFTVSGEPVVADGDSTGTVTVSLVGSDGNPFTGAVTLNATGTPGSGIAVGEFADQGRGVHVAPYSGTGVGDWNVIATADGQAIPLVRGGNRTAHLVVGEPAFGQGLTRLVGPSASARADGEDALTVLAFVTDAMRRPIANAEVVFEIPEGVWAGSAVGPASVSVLSGADGTARLKVTSSTPATYRVSASVGDVQIEEGSPARVEFTPVDDSTTPPGPDPTPEDSVDLERTVSSVRTSSGVAAADGVETHWVYLAVQDLDGNPVSGVQVVFRLEDGNAARFVLNDADCLVLEVPADGLVRVEFVSKVEESTQLTVTIGGGTDSWAAGRFEFARIDAVPPGGAVLTPTDGIALKGSGSEPGNAIAVADAAGFSRCTLTVPDDGQWTCLLVPPAGLGETLKVVETDPSGNSTERTWRVGLPMVAVSNKSVAQGGQQAIVGTGFQPDERIAAVMYSDPIALPGFTARADGSFEATWTVPAGVASGVHRVEVTGALSGTVSTTFEVASAGVLSTGGQATPPASAQTTPPAGQLAPPVDQAPPPGQAPTAEDQGLSSDGGASSDTDGSGSDQVVDAGGDLAATGSTASALLVALGLGLAIAGAGMAAFARRRRDRTVG